MSYELHVEVSKMSIIVTVAVVAGLAALLIAALLSVAHDLLSRFVLESNFHSNEARPHEQSPMHLARKHE